MDQFWGGGGGSDLGSVGYFYSGEFSGSWTQDQMNSWGERTFFGDAWYDLPAQQNPRDTAEQALQRYLSLKDYGFDPTWSLSQKSDWLFNIIAMNNTTFLGQTMSDSLVGCVAYVEGGYNINPSAWAKGGGGFGAVGLMQVRSGVLTDFNKNFKISYGATDLLNPNINVYVGSFGLVEKTYFMPNSNGTTDTGILNYRGADSSSYLTAVNNCVTSVDMGNGLAH